MDRHFDSFYQQAPKVEDCYSKGEQRKRFELVEGSVWLVLLEFSYSSVKWYHQL